MPPKKATKTKKPLKLLLFGDSGVGKTHFALHATPGRTLVYDEEGGTDLYGGFVDFDYWVDEKGFKTRSYRELMNTINYLQTPEGIKNYDTFIIDPISILWAYLQEERQDYKEGVAKRKHGVKANETDLENFTQRDWNIVKKLYNAAINSVLNLPQNVILIAREKEITESKPNGEIVRTGEYTFDGEKNTKYAVDYTIRLTYDEKRKQRKANVVKVRLPGAPIQKGDVIDNPTFEYFQKITNPLQDGDQYQGVAQTKENLYESDLNVTQKDFDNATPVEPPKTGRNANRFSSFWASIRAMGFTQEQVHEKYGSVKDKPDEELGKILNEFKQMKLGAK